MATLELDKIPSEKLVELVVKSVYEGDDVRSGGTEVLGIANLQIGTPPGGWTCNATIRANGQEDTLEVVYDGDRYTDTVVGAGAKDDAREDAAETYTPPKSAQANAQRVLDWREKYGDEVKGMTEVGWTRARQLANGEPISLNTVKRMAQFNRHRQNSTVAPENKATPWKDAGRVSWLGWGGDEGISWAMRISRRADDWGLHLPTYSMARKSLDIVAADAVRFDNLDEALLEMLSQDAAKELVAVAAKEIYTQQGEDVDVDVDSVHVDDGIVFAMIRMDGATDVIATYNQGLWRTDAADPEELVLLASRVIFESGDLRILGIRNLEITPGEKLTFEIVLENEPTGERLVKAVEYIAETNQWDDEVIEGRTDGWRIDAAKKGGGKKRTQAPKCKQQACGMSCISWKKTCRQKPAGVVQQALQQAVGGGASASQNPSQTIGDILKAAATGPNGRIDLSPDQVTELVSQAQKIYLDAKKLAPDSATFYTGIAAGNATPDDWIHKQINQQLGYDGKPKQVTKSAIDAAYANGQYVAYRSMSSSPASFDKRFDDFKNGDFYAGHGIYGHGTYVAYAQQGGAWGVGVAHSAAANYGSGMMRLALDADAKVVNASDHQYDVRAVDRALKDWYQATNDREGYRRARAVLIGDNSGENVSGHLAALMGNDAISLTGVAYDNTYMVVLNRSKVQVQKTKGSMTRP